MRVSVVSGGERTRVVGTALGRRHRPHLLEAWGSRFNVQLERHLAVFRYEDRPGMLGRVGTELGNRGMNIVSAAVGRRPEDPAGGAVMLVTADAGAAGGRRRDRGHGRLPRRADNQPLRNRSARSATSAGRSSAMKWPASSTSSTVISSA